MSHVQTISPSTRQAPPMAAMRTRKKMTPERSRTRDAYVVSFSSVTIRGANLLGEPRDATITRIAGALRAAYEMDKPTMLVENITPWVEIGVGSTAEVAETQAEIEKLLAEAALLLGREKPVCRLTLRGREFDIRCYLGSERPSDFLSAEEWAH